MITFSRLGKKGNLGNQLFQIASTIGLSHKHKQPYVFPNWEYEKFFEISLPHGKIPEAQLIKEKYFHLYEWDLDNGDYDILGYLQTEKYFDIPFTRKNLSFKPGFIEKIKAKKPLSGDPNNILISVRRGDFVHHPWFYQLSYKYYLGALIHNFPDWKNRHLIFISDDISYCKTQFSNLKNSYFIDDLSPIEQLAFGSTCKDFIISNSTFSWWVAWLGEKKDSKVIAPIKNFRGKHAKVTNEKDYFPERWIRFNHHNYSIPLEHIQTILVGEMYRLKDHIQYLSKKIREKFIKKKWKKL
ncbi:alpha-1,2-fucosyltransferase [Gramella sp. KN1008]|uniref:alpha-1,2-fucosyltransferase n=1 Tax=Gramella sp. KN1008 TaxID=2529298 RepID=UPI00103AB78A|nr:alpha-1,2-fucosyltransferase [Gramella sp. KN1008]TBW25573.1 alpha-1,2-fucosyltransferase [Gramella sp. KN1008]